MATTSPASPASPGSPIDIGTLITRSPGVRGGRPCVAGRGVSVMRIAGWYNQGWIPEEIARRLELTLAQVYAALAYYHANYEEIEVALATEASEYDRQQRSQESDQSDQG